MMKQRRLISIEPIEKNIPSEVYDNLESVIFDELNESKTPEQLLEPYLYPIENIQKIAESDNLEYKENVRTMADEVWGNEAWLDALIIYYILMHIITFMPTDFYKMGYSLAKLGYSKLGEELIQVYEPLSPNKKVTCHAIANFYYCATNTPYKAIPFFEKYLEFDSTKANIYLSLGHLYGQVGDMISDEKQLEAYNKAYELEPNNGTIVKTLLTAYEKRHNTEKVKELYPKLIEIMPSPRHSLNYGLYLMSWGKLQEGYKHFVKRFEIDEYPIGYPKGILNGSNLWNGYEKIHDKTLVVHYEEGFGDSIMYGRFLPLVRQFSKRTVFIVQPQLVELFKQSLMVSFGIEIMSDIKEYIAKYNKEPFVHIPLLNTPIPLGVDSHFIPYSNAYLNAPKPVKYDKSKINIGIAYSGDVTSNYNNRNVELKEFVRLSKLSNKIQLYSLQVGDEAKQLQNIPPDVKIIDLGKDFNDFTDTANAIAGLDLVISSDNVVLNLAGALGKRTYGLFNKYPNYRWFDLSKDNVIWYNSVKPFQCEDENDWESTFYKVEKSLKEEFLS